MVITRKMDELKDEILKLINVRFDEFKCSFLTEMKEQIKNDVAEAMKKELKKREELESTVKVLQSSVAVFQKQIKELRRDQEELQQYGRRLLVWVDGIPLEENETSENVLTKVKSLITEAKCDIPDAVIDRAHRIGKVYKD